MDPVDAEFMEEDVQAKIRRAVFMRKTFPCLKDVVHAMNQEATASGRKLVSGGASNNKRVVLFCAESVVNGKYIGDDASPCSAMIVARKVCKRQNEFWQVSMNSPPPWNCTEMHSLAL